MDIKPTDFILPQRIQEEDIDYKIAETIVETINTAALLSEKCFTIFDYCKNEYYYISENPLFLKSTESENKKNYELLFGNSDKEGIYIMHYIQKKAFEFLTRQPAKEKTNYLFSFNVGMLNNGERIDTLYKIKPQVLDNKGSVWLSLAMLEKAVKFTKPQVCNVKTGQIEYFKPVKSEAFENIAKQLTRKERQILSAMAEEKSTFEICDEFQIKEPTYKRQRQEIYRKLGVHSKINAINRAYIYGVID